jgi:hypothetical protein
MKPHRMRMTHNLVLNYNLLEHMDVYVSIALSDLRICTGDQILNM